jgi:outer membrane protein assembly factor BamB
MLTTVFPKSVEALMNRSVSLACRKLISSFTVTSFLLLIAMFNMPANAQTSTDHLHAGASVTASSPGDWTQFLNNSMQRLNPYETVLGVPSVVNLQLKWSEPNSLSYAAYGNPVVANGVIYVGGGEAYDYLYAFDASTGEQLWRYTLTDGGHGVASTPAVANGVVYFATFVDTVVYALDAKTGAKLWSFNAGVSSPPTDITVADGVVYVGGGSISDQVGALYALDANTGALLWSYSGVVASTPAVANGVAYFDVLGGFSGTFGDPTTNDAVAVNARTGQVLWDYFIKGYDAVPPTSATVVANGMVYFSASVAPSTNNVYAVNATTGKTLWTFTIPGGATGGTPAVANGMLYVGANTGPGGILYALNATTGQQLWNNPVTDIMDLSTPAVANGVVYVSSGLDYPFTIGEMFALNASNGAELWIYPMPDSHPNSPIVSNGTVYVTDTHADKPAENISYLRAFSVGADLFLRAMPSATTVHQSDLLTYAFPVWNLGPANADHEVLMTQVPAGTTFDSIRISGTPGLGTCTTPPSGGTGKIVCNENGSMAANATWTVRLTVKVTAPSGATITENAATMADTLDPNLSNNTATVSVNVQ